MSHSSILSSNIKLLRKKKGLSQEALAKRIGITRSSIAAYESKNIEPRLRTLLELAREFDVDLNIFITKKLDQEKSYLSFYNQNGSTKTNAHQIDLSNKKTLNDFLEESMAMKKMYEAFKLYFEFKTEWITEPNTITEKLISDIQDFTKMIEVSLISSEIFIKSFQDSVE